MPPRPRDIRCAVFADRVELQTAKLLSGAASRLVAAKRTCDEAPLLVRIVQALLDVTEKMPPPDAAALLAGPANHLVAAMGTWEEPGSRVNLAIELSRVIEKLDQHDKATLAAQLLCLIDKSAQDSDIYNKACMQLLIKISDRELVANLVGLYLGSKERKKESFLWYQLWSDKFPKLIDDQELVDLLSWPTCVGNYRRFLLRRLEPRTGQHLGSDRWVAALWREQSGLRAWKGAAQEPDGTGDRLGAVQLGGAAAVRRARGAEHR
jgi:hypothetical protein